MGKAIGNICRYLLLPEDTSCEGMGCLKQLCHSRAAGACKAVLWLGASILFGVGLGQLC